MDILTLAKEDLRSLYAEDQPRQIACATGLLGFFSMTKSSDGNLDTTWTDRCSMYKRAGFTQEVYTFVDEFAHSGTYKNCKLYSESHNYSYVIHCDWSGSAVIFVYIKQWLLMHINASRSGIRFLDPFTWQELYRLPDGSKICVTNEFGKNVYICRYVDQYHLQVGQSLFHIDEFACEVTRFCKVRTIA